MIRDAVWPSIFDRYETLLRISEAAGHPWRAWDGSATGVVATAHVLRQELPAMSVDEIVTVLRLTRDEARQVQEDFAGAYGQRSSDSPC